MALRENILYSNIQLGPRLTELRAGRNLRLIQYVCPLQLGIPYRASLSNDLFFA